MSLVQARYNMKADIYTQTTGRDPDTRQVTRTWSFNRTVRCQARSIASEGIRTVGSTEQFDEDYWNEDYVRMNVTYRMSKRDRVRNIRHDQSDESQYNDDDGNPIEFEVLGVQPVQDPFGRTVEYDVLMFRVQDE